MTAIEREYWEQDRIWYCPPCLDAVSSIISSESDESDLNITESMLGDANDLIGNGIFEIFDENDRLARRGQGSSSFNDDG